MYVLIMIVLVGGQSVTLSHLYFETDQACYRAASDFESHKARDYRLKAFCIRGE